MNEFHGREAENSSIAREEARCSRQELRDISQSLDKTRCELADVREAWKGVRHLVFQLENLLSTDERNAVVMLDGEMAVSDV